MLYCCSCFLSVNGNYVVFFVFKRLKEMKIILILLTGVFNTGFCTGNQSKHFETECNTFAQVLDSATFVDKTGMIEAFFYRYGILVTTPRRFGKTINMDMIKTFYEIQVNENGTVIPKEETENFKMFSTKNLNIYSSEKDSFFNQHFGQYPVLHLDFKVLRGTCWDDFIDKFRTMVLTKFHNYAYLIRSNSTNDRYKNEFNRYYNKTNILKLDESILKRGLKFLTELLYLHFDKKVIILVDEYDSNFHEAIFNVGSDIDRILRYVQEFISDILKTNKFAGKSLLNASIKLSAMLSCYAINVHHFPFTQKHDFNKYYGVTETELVRLAKKYKVEDKLEQIKEWYGGYRIAGSSLRIYNTYSIVNYFKNLEFKNYWIEMEDNIQLNKLCLYDKIYDKIMEILTKNILKIDRTAEFRIKQIDILRKMINNINIKRVDSERADLYLNFMLALGYFTTLDKTHSTTSTLITTPNRETESEIKGRLRSLLFLKEKFNVNESEINLYFEAIIHLGEQNNSYIEFGKSILGLFKRGGLPKNKGQLYNPLIAFLWYYDNQFLLVEDGSHLNKSVKRSDFIQLLIIRKDFTGIIIEMTNKRTSYEALHEIVDKRYCDKFDKYGKVKRIISIGLHLDRNGKCGVSYLYNITDINEAVNISIN